MKEVNNLIHITSKYDNIKSILKDGFKASYAEEKFGTRNILVPMISFSNILLRDLGPNEVVDYGEYGIGINREFATTLEINPVCYVYENSIVEKTIRNFYDLSLIPQTIDIIKKELAQKIIGFTKVTDYVHFNPKLEIEVENLINSINSNTEQTLIEALKIYATKTYENAYYQLLLSKPYKVKNKKGQVKIAYNEREWRKGFHNLGFIFETNANGEINPKFTYYKSQQKPHLDSIETSLKIEIENIEIIILKEEQEIQDMKEFLNKVFGKERMVNIYRNELIKIDTLKNLIEKE